MLLVRKNRLLTWCAELFLLLALASSVGCDARTTARGIVLDVNQNPVSGASVRLLASKSGQAEETQTAADGSFFVGIIHGPFAGQFTLTISKSGYATFRQEIQSKKRQDFKVVLTRVDGASPYGP
jgi:hypothetical protein